jgi:site-specific DNA recombinase
MKTCFGYIRVSTQKQGEGASLEAQKDAIAAFASHHHLEITRWFEEKETAAKSGRPIFNQMLKLLQQKAADGLIIHKIDRSARNLKDWAVISDLSDAGVDVYFATESLDFRSRGGRLTADIQAVIAADYIRNLREECKKGIDGRLKQGLFPFRAPLGYLDKGKGQPKVPDPMKAHFITEIFDLYASGQHSLRSLRTLMNRNGLRNLSNEPLSLNGIETILKNTFYCGLITIRRTGMTYQGVHEPLISARVFQRVQDIKAGRNTPMVTRHNHLYRGLFRCGLCDGPMIPELQKRHVYYRCQTSECETKTIREEAIDATIRENLSRLQISDALVERLVADWHPEEEAAKIKVEQAALRLLIADDETRLQRLTDLLIDGTIDNDTYQERRRAIQLRLAATRELAAEPQNPSQLEENRRKFLELMKSLVLLHEIARPDEKRVLVENCYSNRRVTGKNVELEPYNWLQIRKNSGGVCYGAPERDANRTFCALDEQDLHLQSILNTFDRLLLGNGSTRDGDA